MLFHNNTKDCRGAVSLITAYKRFGNLDQCFAIYRSLVRDEKPDTVVFGALLHACQYMKQYKRATSILSEMKIHAVKPNQIIIQMLAFACYEVGDTETAKELLAIIKDDKQILESVDNTTFIQLMKTFGMRGQVGAALHVLEFMLSTSTLQVDKWIFVTMITICAEHKNMDIGKKTHNLAKKNFDLSAPENMALGNALIHLYSRGNQFEEAFKVFHLMKQKDIVTWTAILTGLVLHDRHEEAIQFFTELKKFIQPNQVTFLAVMSAMSELRDLKKAKVLHEELQQSGLEPSRELQTALFIMYARCGNMKEAEKIFEQIPNKDVICWNRMLKMKNDHETPEDTAKFYERMQQENIKENAFTYSVLLDMCGKTKNISLGKSIHEKGTLFHKDIGFLVSLMNMYTQCGNMKHARKLFASLGHLKNQIVWNTMLKAYSRRQPEKTLDLLHRMLLEKVKPDVNIVDTLVEAALRKQSEGQTAVQ